jgi:hypothetical protein
MHSRVRQYQYDYVLKWAQHDVGARLQHSQSVSHSRHRLVGDPCGRLHRAHCHSLFIDKST